jgi:tetratricopeptide (TPR) repeat protein
MHYRGERPHPARSAVSGTGEDAADGHGPARWLFPALLLAATVVAYGNSLSGPFVFDDVGAIVENPYVRRLWPLTEALSAPPQATVAGRPLVSLSLAVNYAIGGLDVRGYHLVNLAIHLLCGWLVYGVVRRTLLGPKLVEGPGRGARGVAFACALIWLVHPLCTETVNYVVQRTESIMAAFYLATLYAAVRAAASKRSGAWSLVAVIACAAGMASKEAMVTAPVAVLLHDRAYLPGTLREIVRRRWRLYAGLAATWLVLAAIMATGPRSKTVGLSLGVSALDYAKNQAVLVAEYLRTAVWPHPLVFDYGYARPLPDGVATPFVVLVAALALGAAILYWRRPTVGYPAVWVFLVLAPTSSIVPIVSEVGAERRMYLPLAGLVVLFVALGREGLGRLGRAGARWPATGVSAAGAASVVLLSGVLAWATHSRNVDYRSAESLWRTAVAARPGNPRAHNNLGHALHLQGRPRDAIPHYRTALDLDERYSQAHFNLGVALADLGRTDAAMEAYRRALELNPELARAHHNLGSELANRGRLQAAIPHFREAVRHAPAWAPARHKLGRALNLSGDSARALEELAEAVRLDPDHREALMDIAWIRATSPDDGLRDGDEAIRLASRAVALAGDRDVTALDTLAAAYAAAGRFDDAVETARRALAVASETGRDQARAPIAERLALYLDNQPYRETR